MLNELSQVTKVQSVLFEPESFIPKSIASQEEGVQKHSLDLKAFEYMTSVQQILEVNYMLYVEAVFLSWTPLQSLETNKGALFSNFRKKTKYPQNTGALLLYCLLGSGYNHIF